MLLLVGCADPPPAPAAAPRVISSAPPFPENAFQEVSPPVADRFVTRSIGETGPAPHRWTGRRVTLDLKNVELTEAFRLLADVGKVNIVVSGDVSGSVTMKLKDVPWDQALHLIASTKNLTIERDGNVYLVRASSSVPSP